MPSQTKRPTIIIGLSGKMGSGKNWVAENIIVPYLQEEMRRNTVSLAFADQLKIETSYKYDIPIERMEQKDDYTRRLLQFEGTEMGRKQNPDIWVQKLDSQLQLFKMRNFDAFVITDIRFENEVEYIQKQKGLVIKIISDEFTNARLLQESGSMNTTTQFHSSEMNVDRLQCDYIFHNKKNYTSNYQDLINMIKIALKRSSQ